MQLKDVRVITAGKRAAALSPLLWQFSVAKSRKPEPCTDDVVKPGAAQSLPLRHCDVYEPIISCPYHSPLPDTDCRARPDGCAGETERSRKPHRRTPNREPRSDFDCPRDFRAEAPGQRRPGLSIARRF